MVVHSKEIRISSASKLFLEDIKRLLIKNNIKVGKKIIVREPMISKFMIGNKQIVINNKNRVYILRFRIKEDVAMFLYNNTLDEFLTKKKQKIIASINK